MRGPAQLHEHLSSDVLPTARHQHLAPQAAASPLLGRGATNNTKGICMRLNTFFLATFAVLAVSVTPSYAADEVAVVDEKEGIAVVADKDGNVAVADDQGNVVVEDKDGNVHVEDADGNTVTMDKKGDIIAADIAVDE